MEGPGVFDSARQTSNGSLVAFDENLLCRLFAGLGSWPNLDDRLIEAGFRVMEASIDQGLDEAGIFLGCRGYPEFLPSSTLAAMITTGTCECHSGFLVSDHLETVWAVRSPLAGSMTSMAITMPAEMWMLDPEHRQSFRWAQENEYANLLVYGFPEDWHYWHETGQRLEQRLAVEGTETALRLLLYLAAAVTGSGSTEVVIDLPAIAPDLFNAGLFAPLVDNVRELNEALRLLQSIRWARVEFAAHDWRPRLGSPSRLVGDYRWVDESHVLASASPGIVDLFPMFSID